MQILVIGQGGREHAIAWKCAQSIDVKKVWVAPGNAGTALEDKIQNLAIAADAIDQLIEFAQQHRIDLTIVGPEATLAAGIVDAFQAVGLRCFGPSQKACQLESSKQFCKEFLQHHQIPTANYACFDRIQPALDYIELQSLPMVIKADGLASGKGVVIANSYEEAKNAAQAMLEQGRFGAAGNRIVIEEFLEGEELSFIVMANGLTIIPLASSQDHKRLNDGDNGPNTGGMGAYSPAPILTKSLQQTILETIIHPTLQGLLDHGISYTGFLYAGLMITAEGPKVLEFNCRLGDPETQAIIMRLQSDLPKLCLQVLADKKAIDLPQWDKRDALTVVIAAEGYPNHPRLGDTIHALPRDNDTCKIFHAGTQLVNDTIKTQGGRVLAVTSLGDSLHHARESAYHMIDHISWSGCFCRRDIGARGLAHLCEN